MVEVSPIRTEQDYEAALAEIESLMAAQPGTAEGTRLNVLVTCVQAYEAKYHAIAVPVRWR